MIGDYSGKTDLERKVGKAVIEAARVSGQASQVAKRIMGEISSEMGQAKGYDVPAVDIIDTTQEIIAMIALPGIPKENIDLGVTEDTLTIDAKTAPRTGKYIRREISALGFKRELKLPTEIKPEQANARFDNGILEIRLPKVFVVQPTVVPIQGSGK